MSPIQLEITPMSPVFGAEVSGVDLADGVDDATFSVLYEAWLTYGVLAFQGQSRLSADSQVAFARRLGPLHAHPAAPTDHENDAVFVIRTHRDSPISNGNGWHSDVSCDEEPPSATMLQVHLLPDCGGGDTLFADMEAAYATMPATDRQRLWSLSAVHTSDHVYPGRYVERGTDETSVYTPSAVHPVVRTHPETGRRSIFVNPSFTVAIDGMSPADSDTVLGNLHEHCTRPEFQIRYRWAPHDVLLWDNRRVQHFAIWDYWPHERSGHRVTVQGTRPFFDPDGPEPEESPIRVSIGRLA